MVANRHEGSSQTQGSRSEIATAPATPASALPISNATEELVDYQMGEQLFRKAIQQLPPQRALVFKMRHEQGMSY